jgi:hypothetical protein
MLPLQATVASWLGKLAGGASPAVQPPRLRDNLLTAGILGARLLLFSTCSSGRPPLFRLEGRSPRRRPQHTQLD